MCKDRHKFQLQVTDPHDVITIHKSSIALVAYSAQYLTPKRGLDDQGYVALFVGFETHGIVRQFVQEYLQLHLS